MKSSLILIFFLIFSQACVQKQSENDKEVKDEAEQEFATEGEREAYMTEQLFKNEYKVEEHEKYKRRITRIDGYTYKFESDTLRIINSPLEFLPIFDKGLLEPGGHVTISSITELTTLSPSPTIKRFSYLLFPKGFLNPTIYFFELTNDSATETTDMKEFIEGSRLTFLKEGWVMI